MVKFIGIFKKTFDHMKNYGLKSFKIYSFYYIKKLCKKPIVFIKIYYRTKSINKPDKYLGRYSTYISSKDIQIFSRKFEIQNTENFKNKYSLKNYEKVISHRNKLLIFSSLLLNDSEKFVDNDLTVNVMSSARNAGWTVKQYFGSPLKNSPYVLEKERISEFENILNEFKPDILCIDSNFQIHHKTFSYEALINFKKKYNFKVLMFVPDFEVKKLKYWGTEFADFIQYSRPSLRNKINFITDSKIICLPGITYDESSFISNFEKVYDIYYSGSDARQRKVFLNAASNTDLKVKAIYGNRISDKSPNYELYKVELSKSRMTFSNGYITKKNSLIAGRFIESILSQSVCLYEECLDVNTFFQPYLHYIPVKNIHEFVKSAQYLKLNTERLKTISTEAYEYYMENYSSKLFWNYIASRIVNK
jgi:hypothetical protein